VGLITEQRLPLNNALRIAFLFLVLGLPALADLRAGQAASDAGVRDGPEGVPAAGAAWGSYCPT
jgi:hypothetical protein